MNLIKPVQPKAYTAAVKAGETDLKAVPSVGKQVLSSLLNWQTAIVAGITLITAYRKEISEWVGSLFKAKNATVDLLSAENQMALARRNAMESSARERTQLDLLYNKLKDVTLSSKERNAVATEWVKKYPQYSNVLDGEKVSLSNLELAYSALRKEIVSTAIARSYMDKIADLGIKQEKEQIKLRNQELTVSQKEENVRKAEIALRKAENNTNEGLFGKDIYLSKRKEDLQDAKEDLEKQKNIYNDINKNVEEYSRQIQVIENHIDAASLFPQPEKGTQEYWQQQVQIATTSIGEIKSEYLKALKAGTTTGIPGAVVKQYQDALKLKTEAEKELLAYNFKSTNGGSYNAILSQQEKVKDLLAKQARDRIRYEEDMYDEIEQIRINALNDGYNKAIAQMELNHEKELRAIDREKEDLLQKRRDEAKAVFNARQEELAKADKKYRKQTFDEDTVSLSDEENTMFDEKYKAQLDVQAKDTKDVWESMLKNYQDYDAKRAAIDKKYNEDVQSLQAEREKAEKAGNTATVAQIDRAIAEAGKKRKEDLSAITLEEFKTDIDWATLFGNLDVLSSSSLDNLRNKLKEFIEAAASKLTPQDLKTLSDAMTNIDLTLADKSPYDVLKTSLKDYKGATQEAAKAQERLNKLQKEGKGGTEEYKAATKELTDAERKRSESLRTMTQATNNIGEKGQQVVQAGSDITDMLTSLGVSVPESISGALDGMGQVMSAMASVDLMKPMSILTGITGTLAGLGKTIGSLFGGKGDKALKDTQRLEQVTNRIAETEKVINSFIEKRIDLIKDATLAEQKSLATTTKQAIDNQKAYYEQLFQGLRGNWILAKKGKNNNLTAEDLGLNSIKDLADFLDSTRLNDLFQNQGFSLRDADKWYELVNSLDNLLNREKELEEKTAQGLIGITFDDAKSALDEFVMDSNTKLSDVADNFEDHMRNAMLNMVKQNYLNKELEKWYDDVGKALSDGSLDETETANLKQAYENAYTGAKNMYDAALKAAGISASGSSYTQEASKRGFAAMSQDSADELNGRFTALQIAGENIQQSNSEQVAAMAQIVTEMRSMRETVFQNFRTNEESLQMIANIYLETQGINENTSLMSKSLVSISKDIAEVKKNTNGLARR